MGNECNECNMPANTCNRERFQEEFNTNNHLRVDHLKENSKDKSQYKKIEVNEATTSDQKESIMIENLKGKKVNYHGTTNSNEMHDQAGRLIWDDGTQLTAHFQEGKIIDKVHLAFKDEVIYQGEVKAYRANGFGKIKLKDGSSYEGNWKDDKPHGEGTHQMNDQSLYIGQFEEGYKTGTGVYTLNGHKYEGQFKKDLFHGKGTFSLANGRVFKGNWNYGIFHGQGEILYENQTAKFVGKFLNGVKEGFGTYYYGDGRKWVGQWHQGKRNGVGKYTDFQGLTTEGFWRQGVKKDVQMDSPYNKLLK